MHNTSQNQLDPITLKVMWTRLLSIADDMATTLERTAFSSLIRVNRDYACGIFDADGEFMAQSSHCAPGQIGAMESVMKRFLAVYPNESLKPGDVLITNDPWIGCGHTPDVYIATPVFHEGRIVGHTVNCAHHIDTGGRVSVDTREVFEEGLIIPVSKLYREGERNQDIWNIIRQNVRFPDKMAGDLTAQMSANHVAIHRLNELLQDERLDDLNTLSQAVIGRTEAGLRQSIAALPDGVYAASFELEETDTAGNPLRIELKIEIKGDEAFFDFTGSSPEVPKPINCVFNYTLAYAVFGLKLALNPELPHNKGAFVPIHVKAPEASILNASFPAPIMWRTAVGQYIPALILAAIADAAPETVIASSGSVPMWLWVYSGKSRGKRFVAHSHYMGGLGARYGKDGLSAVAFPYNISQSPCEIMENEAPMVFRCQELAEDTGGAGRTRGGLGQRVEVVLPPPEVAPLDDGFEIMITAGRFKKGPDGLKGGQPGAPARISVNGRPLEDALATVRIYPGDVFAFQTAGGGGYHDPLGRSPQRVLQDVKSGYIAVESAREHYRVVIDPTSLVVDEQATAELRERRR